MALVDHPWNFSPDVLGFIKPIHEFGMYIIGPKALFDSMKYELYKVVECGYKGDGTSSIQAEGPLNFDIDQNT